MSRQQQQAWADRAGSMMGGAGVGGSATSTLSRERDVAAYEAMKAALPKKPPAKAARTSAHKPEDVE